MVFWFCLLVCISLVASGVDHLFMCLPVIHTSLFGKIAVHVFINFIIGFFKLLSFESSFIFSSYISFI